MKTSILNIKNKGILFLVISLVISHSSFSQNKLVTIISSVNYTIAIPVIFLLSLTIVLFTAFMKQKNH